MSNHIEDFISAYVDNELTGNERQQVEEHLENCPQCRKLLNDIVEIQSEMFAAFHSIQVPDAIEDKVIHAIGSNTSQTNTVKQRNKFLVPLLGILCLFTITLVLTGSFLFKLGSILFKVLFNLVYALGSILGSEPYIIVGIIGSSVLLIVISGISLTHFLKTKTV